MLSGLTKIVFDNMKKKSESFFNFEDRLDYLIIAAICLMLAAILSGGLFMK